MKAKARLENVYWRYPKFHESTDSAWTLKGINLSIEEGECFGITGSSGAGKTTLCKAILGIIPHSIKIPFRSYSHHFRGSVWVDDKLVSGVHYDDDVTHGRTRGVLIGQGVIASR
ncbi:partial Alpha-hemolysin translocation ATP-binding protein HlyB, partial [Methylococcales bacterium]